MSHAIRTIPNHRGNPSNLPSITTRFPESGAPTAPEPHREITVWDAGMDASRLIRKQSKRNIDKTMIYSRPPALPFHRGPLTASGATIQPHYIRRTSQLGFVLGYFGTARPEADRSGVEGREKRCGARSRFSPITKNRNNCTDQLFIR
ncbi:hypothetical protein MTP99_011896 [Tenebrio molitor]|nr:hypothetical protein MTP99_011896 [Tenebrio molitor]